MVLEANGTRRAKRQEVLERLLTEFGLTTVRVQRGMTLSGGSGVAWKSRESCHESAYVLLDEPFTGVDPRSVAELQDVVRYLKERGWACDHRSQRARTRWPSRTVHRDSPRAHTPRRETRSNPRRPRSAPSPSSEAL